MQFKSPLKSNSQKVLLLGSGELGKEVAIEAQRLGLEVIAVDKYENAPAMQVAHQSFAIDMQDKEAVLEVIERTRPDFILPEIEAISIEALEEAESRGFKVIPNAKAVKMTMNRKNIRELAATELGLLTSRFEFAKSYEELQEAVSKIGYPCVVKPVMSSSGHGQSLVKDEKALEKAWNQAIMGARGTSNELIVEEFIEFDYEITLLTVRNGKATTFCEPIGHEQQDGDYIFSWQPVSMLENVKDSAKQIATKVTDALGGEGLFGVELFIKGDTVYFSEVSPRPHDTGLVTLITQSQSEFALHIRAILGLPTDFIFYGAGSSAAIKATTKSQTPIVDIPEELFSENSFVRLFGKPSSHKGRRLGVVLVYGEIKDSLAKAKELVGKVSTFKAEEKSVEESKSEDAQGCVITKIFKSIFK